MASNLSQILHFCNSSSIFRRTLYNLPDFTLPWHTYGIKRKVPLTTQPSHHPPPLPDFPYRKIGPKEYIYSSWQCTPNQNRRTALPTIQNINKCNNPQVQTIAIDFMIHVLDLWRQWYFLSQSHIQLMINLDKCQQPDITIQLQNPSKM